MPHALTDVIDELIKDREKGAELLDLPEVGGAELVERDRLVILVLVVEGVEAGRDGSRLVQIALHLAVTATLIATP